jgi:hypothetical protein
VAKFQSNAQGGVKNCKNLQKIAEKMQRFAKFCKKLQKNAQLFTTFDQTPAHLIDKSRYLRPWRLSTNSLSSIS